MLHTQINDLTASISNDLVALSEALKDPSAISFSSVREGFEALADATAKLATIDATFAWIADSAEAGRVVGSSKTSNYLTSALGISMREANKRLALGYTLFTPPEPVPEDKESNSGGEDPDATGSRVDEKAAKEKDRVHRERKAQKEAQEKARELANNEVLDLIERELQHLNEHAATGRLELFAQAVKESAKRPIDDLRQWLREQIRIANKQGKDFNGLKDLLAAYKKRRVWIGMPDSDRGRKLGGYLDAAQSAVLNTALDSAMKADTNRRREQDEAYKETRTLEQRRADALEIIASSYLEHVSTSSTGVASLVISLTADEADAMQIEDTFITNSGDELSALDVLRLGLAKHDIAVLHDKNGQALTLGRTQRTATFYQKLALFAQEAVCTCGQCTRPALWCDVHHIVPWSAGGRTDLTNLTLQCRSHHTDNNDHRVKGRNWGYMDKDPDTGRAGYRSDVGKPLEFNETVAHKKSNGAKLRGRKPNTSDGAQPSDHGTSGPGPWPSGISKPNPGTPDEATPA